MPTTAFLPALRGVEERNALVLEYQGLVLWVWNRNRRKACMRRLGEEDALAAGQLGLIRAAELWRPEISAFTTYAPPWIWQTMTRAAQKAYTIEVPNGVAQGVGSDEAREAGRRARRVLSSDLPPRDDRPEWVPAVTHDPTPPWLLEDWERVQDALRFVHPVHREPLLWLYRDGLLLEEIGERLGGVTKERVRQLVAKGVRRLCRQLGINYFADGRLAERNRCHQRVLVEGDG